MQLQKIITHRDGQPNGWIMPIFRDYDQFFSEYNIRFIYATSILPNSYKGPHLHHKRQCMLVPILGKVTIVQLVDGKYVTNKLDANDPTICHIPTHVGFKVINKEDTVAILLNLSDHAWKQDDQDSYTVDNWEDAHEV